MDSEKTNTPSLQQHRMTLPKKKEEGRGKVIDFKRFQTKQQERSRKRSLTGEETRKNPKKGKTFVQVHLFPSRMEAEMLGEILGQSDIPYFIQSEDIGLFGPGAGPSPGGAKLIVRKNDLEEAKTLLTGLI